MMKRFFSIAIFLSMSIVLAAQESTIPLQYSFKDGTFIHISDQAISKSTPLEGIAAARISRDNGRGFKELTVLTRAENAAAFRRISGENVWSQIKIMKKLKSDDEVWKFILDHPKLSDYGMLAFAISFRQAMGTAFNDRDAAGLAQGKTWSYRVDLIDANGQTTRTSRGSIQGGQGSFALTNVRQQRAFATDSAVFITWSAALRIQPQGLVTADVFRQTGGKGAFVKMTNPIFANIKQDSITFYLADNVKPQSLYRYFVVPRDAMGNPASPSDTISVLSVNFAALPIIQEVSVTDTLGAIRLNWKSLGNLPHVVGIEIQRSRDARGDYVVLDTVSTVMSTYTDSRVFPDVPYFYRLRTIPLKGMERETGYSGYVTGSLRNRIKNPDPPHGLLASLENGFIKLQWQPVEDPDLYAYFVYRSTSEQGKFTVISPGLDSTVFVDTSRVSGRTQYVYAVKAVSNNSMESDFSNKISLRQPFAQLPLAPGGVTGYLDNRAVVLSWSSMARLDHNIAGYNIYRRDAAPLNTFDTRKSAASQAEALQFVLLNREIIAVPSFTDATVTPGATYDYAVASVDVFGIESTFSPFATISLQLPARVITNTSIRKVTGGIALEWDPAMGTDAENVAIYRKKAGDVSFRRLSAVSKNETAFVDKTAVKGTLYIYEIRGERNTKAITRSEEKNIKF